MARFIGYLQGSRGEASRLDTPSSGIRTTAQGWNCGVTVYGDVDKDNPDDDIFVIMAHGGSNGHRGGQTIASVEGSSVHFPIEVVKKIVAKRAMMPQSDDVITGVMIDL